MVNARHSSHALTPHVRCWAAFGPGRRFSSQGSDTRLTAALKGTQLESSTSLSVIDPFDTDLQYTDLGGVQRGSVRTTNLTCTLTYNVIRLANRLQQAYQSFLQNPSQEFTVGCTEFYKVWVQPGRGGVGGRKRWCGGMRGVTRGGLSLGNSDWEPGAATDVLAATCTSRIRFAGGLHHVPVNTPPPPSQTSLKRGTFCLTPPPVLPAVTTPLPSACSPLPWGLTA